MRSRCGHPLRHAFFIPAIGAGVAMAVLALPGCSGDPILRPPIKTTQSLVAPLATTPVGAVRRLEWSYNKRDTTTNRSLYTEDYRFAFEAADSAGNPFLHHELTRRDELRFAAAFFVLGTTQEPPPASI